MLLRPGSSGSAIIDGNNKILGQLFGGTTAPCEGAIDIWGRFDLTFTFIREFLFNQDDPFAPILDDEFEENDVFADAFPLADGTYPLIMNDDDWFEITVDGNTPARVELFYNPDPLGQEPLDIDIDVFVLGVDGEGNVGQVLVDSSFSRGVGYEVINLANTSATPQTYFIQNYLFSGQIENTYTMVITNTIGTGGDPDDPDNPGGPISDDTFEQNDSFEQAAPILNFVQNADNRTSTVNGVSLDEDWYFVQMSAGEVLTAIMSYDQSVADLDLAIYDVNKSLLNISSDLTGTEVAVGTSFEGDNLFIQVFTFNGDAVGSTYTLNLFVNPPARDVQNLRCFIDQQYQDFLGRAGEPAGLDFYEANWLNGTMNNADIVNAFIYSPEFSNRNGFLSRAIFSLYNNNMSARPTDSGYNIPNYEYMVAAGEFMSNYVGLEADAKLEVITALMDSQGFKDVVGNTLSNSTDFVNFLFEHIYGRPATSEAMTQYTAELDSGSKTQQQLVLEFIESSEAVERYRFHSTVVMCYLGLLNREAEKAGFDFYMERLGQGIVDEKTILNGFIFSPEYQNRLSTLDCGLPTE